MMNPQKPEADYWAPMMIKGNPCSKKGMWSEFRGPIIIPTTQLKDDRIVRVRICRATTISEPRKRATSGQNNAVKPRNPRIPEEGEKRAAGGPHTEKPVPDHPLPSELCRY